MAAKTEAWLKLSLSGLAPKVIKYLFEKFPDSEEIIKNLSLENIPSKIIEKLKSPQTAASVKKILEKSAEEKIQIITLADPAYPEKLKNIFDPPAVLFVKGNFGNPANQPVLAVVGTRRATAYGKMVLEKLIPELAAGGVIIVSGLALGIDAWAHEITLKNNGRAWAVLGSGLDYVYPAQNRGLAQKIAENGALISEFIPGTKPEKWYFPQRNRIIAGLSDGVLVVEADYKSGAMITAKLALDQGREVMTVPGSVLAKNSAGPHWLIKQGAGLVEKPEDILEILGAPLLIKTRQQTLPDLNETQKKIIASIQETPLNLEEIMAPTGLGVEELSSQIMELVILEVVLELPGQRFVLNPKIDRLKAK